MNGSKANPLRSLSLVKLSAKASSRENAREHKLWNDMPLIYLGEIPNMPEHGVFIGHKSGRVYSGYHIWDFEELGEDEV